MPQKIRLWAVAGKKLEEVQSSQVRLEERLEDWLASDISILDPDLLVIGRQVKTDYGHFIDLLCIDSHGDLVIVELKRGKTQREVAAQALDYASWAKELNADRIAEIARGYLEVDLEEALRGKFEPPPENWNESHRSLIVAEAIDANTERIVRYLSELGVPINVATVQAFQDPSGQEMLAQVFLVEPEVAWVRDSSRKRRSRTPSQMQALADANGLGSLYRHVLSLCNVLKVKRHNEETGFIWYYRDSDGHGRRPNVMSVDAANPDNGGLAFVINATRFRDYLEIPLDNLRTMLPDNVRDGSDVSLKWGSSKDIWLLGAFHTVEEVDTFVAKLTEAVERPEKD